MLGFLRNWRFPNTWALFRKDDRLLLILIAVIVGNFSGLAAVALNRGLLLLAGVTERLHHHGWAVFLPGLGAVAAAFFMHRIVKEGKSHGVPEVIHSVSRHGGKMRFRSSFSHLVASCLTIGSGGSAGPEAPVVVSGSAIGSNIARFFSLNERQQVTLVGCGAAGAIASIFNAPISGMVFAIEVILGEWKSVHIIPIAISAVAGTELSRVLQGNQIPFSHHLFDLHLLDTVASAGLAVATAAASVALARSLRFMNRLSGRFPLSPWARAATGGLAVGVLGWWLPDVLGEGYHAVSSMISGTFTAGVWLVAAAGAAKILATSLTLGWGGFGGIFAPSLVIGSFVGLTYHRCLEWLFPAVLQVDEGCFALLGMAGLVSGILQAPLTGIFLIVEITGGYDVILPLIIVSGLSSSLSHYVESASYYLKELVEKGLLLRPGTDARVLADLSVPELLETDCLPVPMDMTLRAFTGIVSRSRRNHFPVENPGTGRFVGMIHLDNIRPHLFNPALYDMVILEQIMDRHTPTVSPDEPLIRILEKMDAGRLFSLPVVSQGRFVGMISKATLLDRYRRELMVQTSSG